MVLAFGLGPGEDIVGGRLLVHDDDGPAAVVDQGGSVFGGAFLALGGLEFLHERTLLLQDVEFQVRGAGERIGILLCPPLDGGVREPEVLRHVFQPFVVLDVFEQQAHPGPLHPAEHRFIRAAQDVVGRDVAAPLPDVLAPEGDAAELVGLRGVGCRDVGLPCRTAHQVVEEQVARPPDVDDGGVVNEFAGLHPFRIGGRRIIDALLRPAVLPVPEGDDADLVQSEPLSLQAHPIDAVDGFAPLRQGAELRTCRQEIREDGRRLGFSIGRNVEEGVLAGQDVPGIDGGRIFLQEFVKGLQGGF